jgi:hypothetical protein
MSVNDNVDTREKYKNSFIEFRLSCSTFFTLS